jgi:hypothetical protein
MWKKLMTSNQTFQQILIMIETLDKALTTLTYT